MKRIVLFSRCELVHLYGNLNTHLSSSFEIIHLAYSKSEKQILNTEYGIQNVICFEEEINSLYLIESFNDRLCHEIDELIIEQSKGHFNLNSAIQSDRTYTYITYEETLLLSQIYFKFWENLIGSNNVSFLIHEPTALFFTYIASVVCKKHNARYLTQIQVIGGNDKNWLFTDGDNGYSEDINLELKNNNLLPTEIERAVFFLKNYRADSKTFFSEYVTERKHKKQGNAFFFLFSAIKLIVHEIISKSKKSNKIKPDAINHVLLFNQKYKMSLFEKLSYLWTKIYYLRYDLFDPELVYYYYPMHLEPEAVVLYWGDGLYKNQVKLIENIASELPPNCWLYVKDHPHSGSLRNYTDLKRIIEIPNVKFIDPNFSGRELIKHSKGVITISGTSGFEALMLNKQVYTFGTSFYSLCSRIKYIKNIRDLNRIIKDNFNATYNDDNELFQFLVAYLNSINEGFTDYFLNYAEICNIDQDANASIVAAGFIKRLIK